jgi:hypothetical protein
MARARLPAGIERLQVAVRLCQARLATGKPPAGSNQKPEIMIQNSTF